MSTTQFSASENRVHFSAREEMGPVTTQGPGKNLLADGEVAEVPLLFPVPRKRKLTICGFEMDEGDSSDLELEAKRAFKRVRLQYATPLPLFSSLAVSEGEEQLDGSSDVPSRESWVLPANPIEELETLRFSPSLFPSISSVPSTPTWASESPSPSPSPSPAITGPLDSSDSSFAIFVDEEAPEDNDDFDTLPPPSAGGDEDFDATDEYEGLESPSRADWLQSLPTAFTKRALANIPVNIAASKTALARRAHFYNGPPGLYVDEYASLPEHLRRAPPVRDQTMRRRADGVWVLDR